MKDVLIEDIVVLPGFKQGDERGLEGVETWRKVCYHDLDTTYPKKKNNNNQEKENKLQKRYFFDLEKRISCYKHLPK